MSICQNFSNRDILSLASIANTSQVYIFQFCDSECIGFKYTQVLIGGVSIASATITPLVFNDMRSPPPTNMRASRCTINIQLQMLFYNAIYQYIQINI